MPCRHLRLHVLIEKQAALISHNFASSSSRSLATNSFEESQIAGWLYSRQNAKPVSCLCSSPRSLALEIPEDSLVSTSSQVSFTSSQASYHSRFSAKQDLHILWTCLVVLHALHRFSLSSYCMRLELGRTSSKFRKIKTLKTLSW